jgi:hypothetical protein
MITTNDTMASALCKAGMISAAKERTAIRAQSKRLDEQAAEEIRERESQEIRNADFDKAVKQAFGGRS